MQRVYHWKHGWIPLDHEAAVQKYGSAGASRHGLGGSTPNPPTVAAGRRTGSAPAPLRGASLPPGPPTIEDSIKSGRELAAKKLGVEPPEFAIGHAAGAPAAFDHHTKVVTVDPSKRDKLEDWKQKKISLGGGLGWKNDVYEEAAVHESTHAIVDQELTPEQQMDALRAGARAAGLPEPDDRQYMNATGAWANAVEKGPDYMNEFGKGPLSEKLSTYASFSNHEALAEALTEFVVSDHPRPFAKAVGEYFLAHKRSR